MRRPAGLFAAAAALAAAALVFDGPAGWFLILASIALAVVSFAGERPAAWGMRVAYLLLAAHLVLAIWFRIESWNLARSGGAAAEEIEREKRERIAEILARRVGNDAELLRATLEQLRLEPRERPAGMADADLFLALDRSSPPDLPAGVGFEIYDREGRLRAWWGDPRGDRLPPDSVAVAVERPLLRAPSGYRIAYIAALWPAARDTFVLAVKDLWSAESPLRREMAETDLLAPRLQAIHDLAFHVVPPGFEERTSVEPASVVPGPGGTRIAEVHSERFLIDRYLESRRADVLRLLGVLLAWPLLWSVGLAWQAVRREARNRIARGEERGWALGVVGQAVILLAVWAFLTESRLLALFLPEAWFSPLAFAAARLGRAGRSAGDLLLASSLLAFLCVATATLVHPRDAPPRMATAALAGLGAVVGAVLTLFLHLRALEAALAGMSPAVFFSPTILFSPPFLMVLLAFALLLSAVTLGLAALLRRGAVPVGRAGIAAAGATLAGAVAIAAWRMPEAALSGRPMTLVLPLALGLAGGAWLVDAAARRGRRRSRGPRQAIVAAGCAALVTLPLAAHARVEAAHELLVERAERIGQSSTQWLQYTMVRSVEFLQDNALVRETIRTRDRDGALAVWSRSPLHDLDYASALYVFDSTGAVVSQFALTAEDLSGTARGYAQNVEPAQVALEGTVGTGDARWAVVPIFDGGVRIGTAVAMTTEALELRPPSGAAFLLTDLFLFPSAAGSDLPGYELLPPGERAPPRTLLTTVEAGVGSAQLAMPLDPLLPGARGYAVFVLVGALAGLALGGLDRLGDPRARARWRVGFRTRNPLRSFRVQLLIAFLAVAAVPLALYAVLGYRTTRAELEEGARTAAADALSAASGLLAQDEALAQGTGPGLGVALREIALVLQQDLILYWRGRTVASSRPEIFASQLFADRMPGEVYVELFEVRQPVVFDETLLGERSFLVAYTKLDEGGIPMDYALATPLLIREDRVRIDLQRLGEGVFLLSAFSIGFLLVVGWWLARVMARPLSALERGTRQIAAGHLGYRLPPPRRQDEFGRLERSFNAMGERLDLGQRALEREKSRVQAILSAVGAGVVALDAEGRVRLINDRAADLLEQTPDAVVDRSIDDLLRADGATAAFWREVGLQRERPRRGERDLVLRRNGEERHYHLVATRLVDAEGAAAGVVIAFEDITANVQSQRVLAWGEMARQVAHEIKNPLTPMKLSLQHLERVVEDRRPDFERVFHDNLDLVLAEIERLERIAGSFARFGTPDATGRTAFDALDVARDTVALYAPGEERVEYTLETEGEPRPLLGDAEGFRRVLVNLLQNAREAVLAREGGSIVVRLDWEREPGWGWATVLDDGIGLPEEGLDRLFQPSFSTKTRGTGLGLAITRRIVESWGGTIDWERRGTGGTAMHVRLRASDSPPS